MAGHSLTNATDPTEVVEVPLFDLREQFAELREEIMPEIESVMESQQFINGPAVGELECDVAGYCGSRFSVGVSSGTDALICAMMAMGIGPGDEVITTPFTFFATVGSIWRLGAKPVFVDIEPTTFNLNPDQLEDAVTERTKAIVPVHLFGQMTQMGPILDLAARRHLLIIEDAAQAIGATQGDAKAGSLGHAGAFSFFPTKNLGGAGDGGMIVTDDEDLAKRLHAFRNHGGKDRYVHEAVGGNFRLDTIQAAYLRIKLRHLERWSQRRRDNAALYDQLMSELDEITTPVVAPGNTSIFNQYTIRVANRDALRDHLAQWHIGSAVYYPTCLHEQQCFRDLGYRRDAFPEAERASDEVLSLPIYPELSEAQIRYVAQTIRAFYSS